LQQDDCTYAIVSGFYSKNENKLRDTQRNHQVGVNDMSSMLFTTMTERL